ncbi:MAG: MerR family transcriptional regulator [Acidobacteria bacterium]|nr:MerR family transcriptional regulator [Acidobacteriota bacterium]
MRESLRALKGRTFIGVAELAVEAAKILSQIGPVQGRGTVTEVPDERTLRYYLSEGLLAPAEDKQGTASVFGYTHLLQLLVVKKLQAEHLPIRKIKELVAGRTERELERLLGGDEKHKEKNEAINYLESLLTYRAAAAPSQPVRQKSPASQHNAYQQPSAQPLQAQPSGGSWFRIEIEPGLELHIRDDYEPPKESKRIQRLANTIIQSISRGLGRRGR